MLGQRSHGAPALVLFLAMVVGGCSSPPTAPTDADARTNLAAGQAEIRSTTVDGLRYAQSGLRAMTLDHLRDANWDCQQRVPGLISCAPPGIGLPPIPSLGENGRPAYQIAVFALDGTSVGTAHFLRADLYHGQTCAFTGQPYVLRALIGYSECFKAY